MTETIEIKNIAWILVLGIGITIGFFAGYNMNVQDQHRLDIASFERYLALTEYTIGPLTFDDDMTVKQLRDTYYKGKQYPYFESLLEQHGGLICTEICG